MRFKITIALLFAVLFMAPAGWTQNSYTIDHVDGLHNTDTLLAGGPAVLYLRMNNNSSSNITGITTGFRIYSETGATWGGTVPALTGTINNATMMEQTFVNAFDADGMGSDTVGFGGFRLFQPGIPDGFNEIIGTITLSSIDLASHCGEICIDSSFYQPANTWKWSTEAGDFIPTFDKLCYTIFDPSGGPCAGGNTEPVLDPIGDKFGNENALLSFGVTASDPEADALTLSMTSDLPVTASFVDNGDGTGSFDWTPTFTEAGIYSATFSVFDGEFTVSETIEITIDNVNQTPVLAAIGNQIIDENVNLTFGASASDADGDPLTLTMTGDLADTYFTDNGDGTGSFDWTPGFTDAGVYNVTISATDGLAPADESFTITVENVNRVPVLAAIGDQVTVEEVLLNFGASATDADGEALTLSMTSDLPVLATFTDNGDGTALFAWLPLAGEAGIYSATITASDGTDVASETIAITVTAGNAPPVLAPIGDKSFDENLFFGFGISASDADGTFPSLAMISSELASATFTDHGDGTGQFDASSTFDDAGVYEVVFQATDNDGTPTLTDTETILITINNVNQLPEFGPLTNHTVDEGVNLNFDVTATDLDLDALTFTIDSAGAFFSPPAIFIDNGDGSATFDWTPGFNASGVNTVSFSVSDGTDVVLSSSITITVIDINQAPSLDAIGNKAVAEGANLNFGISASDNDGDPITLSMTSGDLPLGATFADNGDGTGTFDWTTTSSDGGLYSATFTAEDGRGAMDEETIEINVTNVNFPPVIEPIANFNITECDIIEATFSASNQDNDPISLVLNGMAENMDFTDNGDGTGFFSFAPNFSQAGEFALELVASDGIAEATEFFTVFVENCQPGSPGDTLFITNTPGVPGSEIMVPMTFSATCDLVGFDVIIGWESEFVNLDAVDFTGSALAPLTDLAVTIDNVGKTVVIHAAQMPGDGMVGAGFGMHLADMSFSISSGAPDGAYQISPFLVETLGFNPMYTRDCGGGPEEVQPFVHEGGGFITVALSETAVCGTVVDELWNEITGATVELWDMFPAGTVEMTDMTNSFGSFQFDGIVSIPFDLYAVADGYYPGTLSDVNFGETGLVIQLQPWTPVTPTNEMVFFYCGANLFMGGPVPVGSVIDAYDVDGVRCGSQIVTTAGEYDFMAVYRDDPFTTEDEGAEPGEAIRFYINGIEAVPTGNNSWTVDKDQIEVCLEVNDQVNNICVLNEGWNLVSWSVDTPSDEIESVLASIADCIDFVVGFEQGGLAYDPALLEFSTLHNVDHLSGYWIKIKAGCSATLDIRGTAVPATSPIPVTAGWNLVSYLPSASMMTATALASISDNLIVAIGYDMGGTIYEPGQPGNTLIDFAPCLGYWVKVSANDVLTYPTGDIDSIAPAPIKGIASTALASDSRFDDFAKSTRWVNLYSHNLTVDGKPVTAGSVVTAISEDGHLVGRFEIGEKNMFGFMSVYGDDLMTNELDGIRYGETFSLVIDDVPTNETFTWSENGDRIEISALTTKDGDSEVLPISFELEQNYPNPFNPSTTIRFNLPKAGKATIEVYNILGKLVARPFDGMAISGSNQVEWDGRGLNGKTVASGIYFYRLNADNYSQTKKMTLLK